MAGNVTTCNGTSNFIGFVLTMLHLDQQTIICVDYQAAAVVHCLKAVYKSIRSSLSSSQNSSCSADGDNSQCRLDHAEMSILKHLSVTMPCSNDGAIQSDVKSDESDTLRGLIWR